MHVPMDKMKFPKLCGDKKITLSVGKTVSCIMYDACLECFVSLQVNDTVLTDVQGNGQIASASDISPPYPSQRSISLPAGNICKMKRHAGGTAMKYSRKRRVLWLPVNPVK